MSVPPVGAGDVSWQGGARATEAGELLVGYAPGASAADRARARGRARASLRQAVSGEGGGVELVALPPGLSLEAAARALSEDPAVASAEPNFTYQHQTFPTDSPPDDPRYGELWGLSAPNDVDMDVPQAWAVASSASRVYVGVIDEGVDWNHPDLAGVVQNPLEICGNGIDDDGNGIVDDCRGYDFVNNDTSVYDGSPSKPSIDAHGTHVSGTIAAKANNGLGVAGVSLNTGIISAKFLGTRGGSTSNAIRAVDYLNKLKDEGAAIVAVNNSWGGGGFSSALYDAIARAGARGIVYVIAAGNETNDNDAKPSYPCSYGRTQTISTFSKGKVTTKTYPGLANIVCVAAHDASDNLASFSNWGKSSVHVGAPGVSILSTTPNAGYGVMSGTSMATPHVTGLVALLTSAGMSTRDAQARVVGTTVPTAALATKTASGGRANAWRALTGDTATDP